MKKILGYSHVNPFFKKRKETLLAGSLPFSIGDSLVQKMTQSVDDTPTERNYFCKVEIDKDSWFTFDSENELPILTPNQMFDRLYQLTKRQKPTQNGFLSNGTIIGRVAFGQVLSMCIALWLDTDAGGIKRWRAYSVDSSQRHVHILI